MRNVPTTKADCVPEKWPRFDPREDRYDADVNNVGISLQLIDSGRTAASGDHTTDRTRFPAGVWCHTCGGLGFELRKQEAHRGRRCDGAVQQRHSRGEGETTEEALHSM